MTDWTPEQDQQVRDGWKKGLSAGRISKELLGGAFSRSAVGSKIRRLDLEKRGALQRKTYDNSKRTAKASARAAAAPAAAKPKPPEPIDDDQIPAAQRRALVDLTNETCRWPVGHPLKPDFFFCGEPRADFVGAKPYCPGHARIAYQPSRFKEAA